MFFLLRVCDVAVILYLIDTCFHFLFLEQIKYNVSKTAINYFGSRQFQRVGRWRGNKQYLIVGLTRMHYVDVQV